LHDSGRNLSLLVTDEYQQWVVRIATQAPAKLAVDPRLELRCLSLAAEAGLAPKPAFAEPDSGVLVCPYLVSDAAVSRDVSIRGAATLLRHLHALPTTGPPLDLTARWAHYCQDSPVDPAMLEALAALEQSTPSARLCHNDLLSANRLRHEGCWYAVDFEYAAWGDPCLDLAVIIEGDALNNAEVATLLSAYAAQPTVPETLRHRVSAWREVHRYTVALWAQAAGNINLGSS
jgi:thiamine kinase